ncbi:hypothetical protein [Pontibacillus marinus]|uniref:Lipoprotein n=1 Tax=Pontibacillus marinus BH030004 = DSM 16465 TaxID=1385511 RepID=A0A0A5HKK4_9BACI|nr:hypothetical protein [Pontibacillus marinus]KGX84172.1 hypothetical protein N783_18690 [Pontibacillus marinus BH030004 = DSM 16465]
MKKFLLLMFLFLILSACSQSEEDKIQKYLDDKTSYDISTVFKDGVLNIEVPMIDQAGTWNKDGQMDVNRETIILLEAVKRYPREDLDLIKEANIQFMTRETNKVVAKIHAKSETFMETNWSDVDNPEVSQIVDEYNFNGQMK